MRRFILLLSLLLLIPAAQATQRERILDTNISGNQTGGEIFINGNFGFGQSFRYSNGQFESSNEVVDRVRLTEVMFSLGKTGSPTGTVNVFVYTADRPDYATALPTGTALASGPGLSIASLTGTISPRVFQITGTDQILLSPNTVYVATVEITTTGTYDLSNYIQAGVDVTGRHEGNGIITTNDGATWTTNVDTVFHVEGDVTTSERNTGPATTPDQPSILPALTGGTTTIVLVGVIAYFLFLKRGRSRLL